MQRMPFFYKNPQIGGGATAHTHGSRGEGSAAGNDVEKFQTLFFMLDAGNNFSKLFERIFCEKP
jgi:hypothetical protein